MPTAFAIAAHPDDIEFLMAGTLLLLRQAGWETHYLNVANGSCGSMEQGPVKTAARRRGESRRAAALLEARWHPSLVRDAELYPEDRLIRRLAAVIRDVNPAIILTHGSDDYMADHTNCCRAVEMAAFVRGMPNFRSQPVRPPAPGEVVLYHSLPHGLRDPLRRPVVPGLFIDTATVQDRKRGALAAHGSQKSWLDRTQGMDSYLHVMDEMAAEVGRWSGKYRVAEGWRRHSHLGYAARDHDLLAAVLGPCASVNGAYEAALHRPAPGRRRRAGHPPAA